MECMEFKLEPPLFEEYLQDHQKIERSDQARSDALDFAHPVDAGIIRILDSPLVNKPISSVMDVMIDSQYGMMLATGLRVDNQDVPLAKIVRKCAETLKIEVPYTIISSSISGLNALAVGSDNSVYIAISSLLQKMFNEEELRFVVGHECGHIALGHTMYHTLVATMSSFADMIPIVGPVVYKLVSWPLKAWSRRSEISADRAGLLCCGDVKTACRVLLRLEAGFTSIENFDIDTYISDTIHSLRHSQIGYLRELTAEHPILAKRMEALMVFANSEKYYRITGKTPEARADLYSDEELNHRTEQIISVI